MSFTMQEALRRRPLASCTPHRERSRLAHSPRCGCHQFPWGRGGGPLESTRRWNAKGSRGRPGHALGITRVRPATSGAREGMARPGIRGGSIACGEISFAATHVVPSIAGREGWRGSTRRTRMGTPRRGPVFASPTRSPGSANRSANERITTQRHRTSRATQPTARNAVQDGRNDTRRHSPTSQSGPS